MPRPPIEDAKDRLLAAGLILFSRLGTERVNSNAIAKRARLGVGTFYAHFPDKHALLREIQLRTLTGIRGVRLAAVVDAAADPAPGRSCEGSQKGPGGKRGYEAGDLGFIRKHGPRIEDGSMDCSILRRLACKLPGCTAEKLGPDGYMFESMNKEELVVEVRAGWHRFNADYASMRREEVRGFALEHPSLSASKK